MQSPRLRLETEKNKKEKTSDTDMKRWGVQSVSPSLDPPEAVSSTKQKNERKAKQGMASRTISVRRTNQFIASSLPFPSLSCPSAKRPVYD
mmetsp:Transcript_15825/g.32103  ORF Transcript_15825/g.32103 Transcript_15825/m.32103 type:complete len:91 (-) Transcript_15825:1956-2228(-)